MALVLPGNARSLRFTGESKSLAPPAKEPSNGGLALGKPRVRKPPAPAPTAPAPTAWVMPPPPPERFQTPAPAQPIHHRVPAIPANGDLYRVDPIPTPYAASYLDASMAALPSLAGSEESFDDHDVTRAMERDAREVLPGGGVTRMPKPASLAPIPHFRPASAFPTIVPQTASTNVKMSGAPLAVWLVAAVLVGVVSYFVAPEIVARVETPSAATSRR